METWELVEQLLGARLLVAPQQVAQRKESFTLKLVWLRDCVYQMPPIDDPETLRQYARCYIMLLIRGYLMMDKSNNLVHLRWLPLLQDFGQCRALSWCSILHSAVDVLDIPEISSVVSTGVRDLHVSYGCESRDQHEARVLRWRVAIESLYGIRTTTLLCRLCALLSSSRKKSWGHGCQSFPLSASMLCSFTNETAIQLSMVLRHGGC
ncbi:hypothetical protein Ahy_A03g014162 [Arachis hypogaea]|uniref:Aminotransferase-like plant mobile domain-containing protein n=1 Tax=Arachis hypogaea TaxID=3818 RepID=A0A445DX42_ARAHY|nr:hypothetical protein Ahy_A03g014162 [Arachis hypogaea]